MKRLSAALSIICFIVAACTSAPEISQERANYLRKRYVGIDPVAFNSEKEYIKHLDLFDKMVSSMLSYGKELACSDINDQQYWNHVWQATEPERQAYLGFCTRHYITTVGFDRSFKASNYDDFISYRNKLKQKCQTTSQAK